MSTQSTTLHPKADRIFIQKILSPEYRTYTNEDADEIFRLYKKHIQYRYSYSKSCDCSNGIGTLWNELKDWYSRNENQFEK